MTVHWHLLEKRLKKTTRVLYKKAVADFTDWVDDVGHPEPRTSDELDQCLTGYIHDLYDTDRGVDEARRAYYGITKLLLPSMRHGLPTAKLSISSWEKSEPPRSHPPLSWKLTVAIAMRMATDGNPDMAIGTLLAFECYLRIGELIGLRFKDVAGPGDPRTDEQHKDWCLRLRKTKTGRNQWVHVRDRQVASLLRDLMASLKPGQKLFGFTADYYRRYFKRTCADLGLSAEYVPHSLRHGGATRDHVAGMGIEDILLRGRWASNDSARRYIQRGRALLLSVEVPAHVAASGRTLSKNLRRSLCEAIALTR